MRPVGFHRADAQAEVLGDFAGAATAADQFKNFQFPIREATR